MTLTIAHLVTQIGQPYGSVRKCCQECGTMTVGESAPPFTDDPTVYEDRAYLKDNGYVRCLDVPRDLRYSSKTIQIQQLPESLQ